MRKLSATVLNYRKCTDRARALLLAFFYVETVICLRKAMIPYART